MLWKPAILVLGTPFKRKKIRVGLVIHACIPVLEAKAGGSMQVQEQLGLDNKTWSQKQKGRKKERKKERNKEKERKHLSPEKLYMNVCNSLIHN